MSAAAGNLPSISPMTSEVYLADSDKHFDVAEGESVLAAGLRQHFALPFGCQSGGCGSCRVRLRSGEVDYPFPPPALSPEEVEAGYILMCLARPRGDLTVELRQPAQLEALRPRTLPVRVLSRTPLAHDVIGLRLKLPKGLAFAYLPGQYIDFLLDDGRRRSFSIANAPNGEFIELHLRVTPGGKFAQWVRDEMPERAILRLEGPLGAFYIREESARPIVLVAGGTGFAPARAMLEGLFAQNSRREVHLFCGARSRRDMYWHDEVGAWASAQAHFTYVPVLSEPDADWTGERGFVHEAMIRALPDLSRHEIYLSGPPAMVRAGKHAAIAAGLDADHLFYDSFDYAFETWPGLESKKSVGPE
jgi:CDP-4-dehydro-6-deoxyglucose reductase